MPADQLFDNDYCLGCHAVETIPIELPSGEILDAAVDPDVYAASVHGELDMSCVLCHTDITGYPHGEIAAVNRRDVTQELATSCFGCHESEYSATRDNMHEQARQSGHPEAAVCADCHGWHDVKPPGEPPTAIPQTCRNCHSELYDLYEQSVHGAALTEGNRDVPTCTDCHGVHDIEGPAPNNPFHLFSPLICKECHADKELMDKYGISTAVFDSYVADFHGTTVVLFEDLAPDQQTNKPVCGDCHGVHHIVATNDPESTVFRENILGTCQRCHPDATANFPTAWLSHYEPSLDASPLVWLVNLFYRIAIPTLIGAMVVFVLVDLRRRFARTRRLPADG